MMCPSSAWLTVCLPFAALCPLRRYIVAKAIRDGVIDATLDHGAQELRSNENVDIYATTEPQELYHKRIQFCLNIHNEAVQAMSYPDDDSGSGKEGQESVRSCAYAVLGYRCGDLSVCLPACLPACLSCPAVGLGQRCCE